jgi:hypothetical protein
MAASEYIGKEWSAQGKIKFSPLTKKYVPSSCLEYDSRPSLVWRIVTFN